MRTSHQSISGMPLVLGGMSSITHVHISLHRYLLDSRNWTFPTPVKEFCKDKNMELGWPPSAWLSLVHTVWGEEVRRLGKSQFPICILSQINDSWRKKAGKLAYQPGNYSLQNERLAITTLYLPSTFFNVVLNTNQEWLCRPLTGSLSFLINSCDIS